MKKYLSIIAILLILCFAFAACDQYTSNAIINVDNKTEDEMNGPMVDGPDPYAVDYNDIVNQWLEYVSFTDSTQTEGTLSSTELFTADDDLDVSIYGYILITSKTETVEKYLSDGATEATEVLTKTTLTVYDLRTGNVRATYVSTLPVVSGNEILDAEYTINDFVEYRIDAYSSYGFYRVQKTVLVLRDDFNAENGAEPTFNDYVEKSTFSYYGFNGDAILLDSDTSAFETRPTANNVSGRFLLDLVDTTYLMTSNDGEIIKEFALGEEYDIPVYNESANTLVSDQYTYFEAHDFKYVLTESTPSIQKLGDLTMYTVPGMTVTVFNENYEVLVDYKTSCYHVAGYAVLGSGALYICEYDMLPSTATEFDFELADMKFNALHKIVDPKSGKIETIELDYIVSGMFNNVTGDIRSFTTATTTNVDMSSSQALSEFKSLMDTCSVKNGYTLAQVQKIEEGALATESVFVVFDDELNIVAELPKFMPNQIGYASFVEDGLMLVNVTAMDNKTVSYMIDTKKGTANLFVHEYLTVDRVTVIEGGYFFNGIVYDTEWRPLCNFYTEGYDFKFITNDRIFFTEYNEEGNIVLNSGHIYQATPEDLPYFLTSVYICAGDTIDIYDDFLLCYEEYEVQVDEFTYTTKWNRDYYNLYGDALLFTTSEKNDSIFFNGDTAYYSGAVSVNITAVSDGVYLAECSVNYTMVNDSGISAENMVNFPTTYSETTYYIFK